MADSPHAARPEPMLNLSIDPLPSGELTESDGAAPNLMLGEEPVEQPPAVPADLAAALCVVDEGTLLPETPAADAPPPPTGLNAEMHEGEVMLRWKPCITDGAVHYRVVSQIGKAPASPHDGLFLCDTEDTLAVDNKPARGARIYYAVFTCRDDVFSEEAAVCCTERGRPTDLPEELPRKDRMRPPTDRDWSKNPLVQLGAGATVLVMLVFTLLLKGWQGQRAASNLRAVQGNLEARAQAPPALGEPIVVEARPRDPEPEPEEPPQKAVKNARPASRPRPDEVREPAVAEQEPQPGPRMSDLEQMLLTGMETDQQRWDQAWHQHLNIHIAFRTAPRTGNRNTGPPTLQGLQHVRLENRTPCVIRVLRNGPIGDLSSKGSRQTSSRAWEMKPDHSLSLQNSSVSRGTLAMDLDGARDGVAGNAVAVRRGELCILEVLPTTGGKAVRLQVEYVFALNKSGDVLYARYQLRQD